jgi:hypothetical protein
LCVRP